jgi:nucleoid-associated protein YgaU
MKKGQNTESIIKNILKFFKMNENSISTFMGGVVILIIAALIFNYFRTTNLKTWQGLLLNQDQTATTSVNEENKVTDSSTYKVKKGDDLWHISENIYKSGYNYVDIMKANNIKGDGTIYEGMELKIPNVEAKKRTVAENKTETVAPSEEKKVDAAKEEVVAEKPAAAKTTIEAGEYVTKRGDSYWSIALRSYGDGYAWVKIYEANKKIFGHPDMIHADVKIVIPSLK